MAQDLPIYSDSFFRGANPFASLDRARGMDLTSCLERFDRLLNHGEGNEPAGEARLAAKEASREVLLGVHRLLFPDRPEAGLLRASVVAGVYPGQDCPEPEHIGRSIQNLEQWLGADSFGELHPVEQTALCLTRLVDIWPFEMGNTTTAVVFANQFLLRSGYPPFFVLANEIAEFDQILAQAIRMQTEPLVRAIYKCTERELDLAGR